MQTVLIVIHLMIVLALVGVVLIQRSEGGGLGIGGGSGFMSARGTANALTRTTAILATLFFITSLAMGILARYEPQATDILDRIPGTTTSGGVLDSLGGDAPATPADGATQTPSNGVPTDGATAPATTTPSTTTTTPATTTTTTPATTTPSTTTPATGADGAATPAVTPSTTTPVTPSDVPSGQ